VEADWERVWTVLDSIKLHKPPKDVYEKFLSLDVAGKSDQLEKELDEMNEQFKIEAGDEDSKINKIAEYYTQNVNTLSTIGRRFKGQWKLNTDVKEMHGLSNKDVKRLEEAINDVVGSKDWQENFFEGEDE